MLVFLLAGPIIFSDLPSAATSYSQPRIIQFTSGYTSGGSDQSVSLTFQKPVTKGDVIVVCAGIVSGNFIKISTGTFVDVRGVSFQSIVGARTKIDTLAQAWYGTLTSSGPESIRLSYNSGPAAIFGYEISPSSLSAFSSATHSGSGTSKSQVAAYDPGQGSLVMACGGFFTLEGAGTVSHGSGYVPDQSFSGNNAAEHLSGFSGNDTKSVFHFSMVVHTWSEVSVSFEPLV
jgi:hypothetical protein